MSARAAGSLMSKIIDTPSPLPCWKLFSLSSDASASINTFVSCSLPSARRIPPPAPTPKGMLIPLAMAKE